MVEYIPVEHDRFNDPPDPMPVGRDPFAFGPTPKPVQTIPPQNVLGDLNSIIARARKGAPERSSFHPVQSQSQRNVAAQGRLKRPRAS
jgi:hypothetical protein